MSKKNKRRHCPALGKEITSQECGADRQSRIACTADCPFNPFNPENYDDFGAIESAVVAKCRDRLLQGMTPERRTHFLEQRSALGFDIIGAHDHFQREFFRRRDFEGRNFFDHWAGEGWEGLNNDERVYIECHRRMRPALLQVQWVLDFRRLQVVDLLDSARGPFVVVDRTIAGSARRFQTGLSWVFSAPHYDRPIGAAVVVRAVGPCDELEVLQEIAKHLGGPAEVADLPDWLWDNFVNVSEAMHATMGARRADSLRLTDTKHGKATYRINGSFADLGDVLSEDADIEEADLEPGDVERGFERRYDVFDRTPAGQLAGPLVSMPGDMVLGSMLLGKTKIRVEADSGARFVRLKAHLERAAGGQVTFLSEQIKDSGAQAAEHSEGTWDPALVPPRLLEEPEIFLLQQSRIQMPKPGDHEGGDTLALRLTRETIRNFIDTHVPALNGLTPREAAADPVMRPVLVRIMKGRVKGVDDMRYEKGLDLDLNDQLEELGLPELIFPPPPIPEVTEEDDEDEEVEEAPAAGRYRGTRFTPQEQKLFSTPPPLLAVLSETEVADRADAMLIEFPDPEDLLEYFDEEWSGLSDAMDAATDRTLNNDEFTMLAAMAARAVLILFPDGPPDTPVSDRRLAWYFAEELKGLSNPGRSGSEGAVIRYIMAGPQPHLTTLLSGMVLMVVGNKDCPPGLKDALKLLPVIKAVVRELCQLSPP